MKDEKQDEEFFTLMRGAVMALERIAKSLEMSENIDLKGMEIAKTMADAVADVITQDLGMDKIHKVDVPTHTDGDLFVAHIEQHLDPGEVVMCKICERTMKEIVDAINDIEDVVDDIIASDEYDPEDDTYATGKECPNCGYEKGITKHTNGPEGMEIHYHCDSCHHIWPYVLAKDRS